MAVDLSPPDPDWAAAFAREQLAVQQLLGSNLCALHHIGSTAIPGIFAKPVIDMLGEVISVDMVGSVAVAMQAAGWQAKDENGIAGRRYFVRADSTGKRTHHLHVFAQGDASVWRHLAFRDYLIAHPARAQDYSQLKASILAEGVRSRAEYQLAKADMIAAITREALRWHRRGAG